MTIPFWYLFLVLNESHHEENEKIKYTELQYLFYYLPFKCDYEFLKMTFLLDLTDISIGIILVRISYELAL